MPLTEVRSSADLGTLGWMWHSQDRLEAAWSRQPCQLLMCVLKQPIVSKEEGKADVSHAELKCSPRVRDQLPYNLGRQAMSYSDLKPLHQQVVVITGASSGIGLVAARIAARAGAGVLLASRNEDALQTITAELQANGAQAAYVVADVSKREDHKRIARTAFERFGGFDSWVNNASVGTAGELNKVTLEDHRQVFEVNYWGVVYGSLEAATYLRGRGGAIINIGSVLGERTVVLQGPYCAAKHA